tara:strand:- start:38 stop:712 length:675 start_codon:yes stop_codon:yes gene_type:complete
MSKLGYTWYPKDWGNSEAVFELTLEERGLYRELIDMAMLNDNTTECNYNVWSRKFNIDFDDILVLLDKIAEVNLIEYVINEDENIKDTIFIPSCEPRLKLSRGGKNGGIKSRKSKPTVKPIVSLVENNSKPTPNQIEKKVKEKESKENIKETLLNNLSWLENIAMKKRIDLYKVKKSLIAFLDDLELKDDLDRPEKDIKQHFVNLLNIELKKEAPVKVKPNYKI